MTCRVRRKKGREEVREYKKGRQKKGDLGKAALEKGRTPT
jgi:hypothetical protein